MSNILSPQDSSSNGITYYHQTEPLTPIGRVHLNGHLFILGYLLDMMHALQVATDGFLVDTILEGKLTQRLLALYIVGYYL